MYFPILRGRQFELLALRECVSRGILSEKVIPVIEPVKVSSTYVKTIDAFIQNKRRIAVIRNPLVGSWEKDILKDNNKTLEGLVGKQYTNKCVISTLYVTPQVSEDLCSAESVGIGIENMILICDSAENIKYYEDSITGNKPMYNIIPDKGDFRRRIRANRVMCEDHFPKQPRNINYADIADEFYSSDHLYYIEDGYKGFSDYSIVGKDFVETGFAPVAVVIHIVYFDDQKTLRIAHFVSDTNDDINDPARKFAEAVEKLVKWNEKMNLHTIGIQEFEEAFKSGTYPGLGVVKKLSIMHHLELISKYLDEAE